MKTQIDFAYREHVGTLTIDHYAATVGAKVKAAHQRLTVMFGPMRFVECHSARMFGEARTLAVFEVRTDRETCRVEF
jgi:hypothetical protein